ncbi:XkdQ/YqbQ family protein [Paenibacillus eucommiae]|uniref:YqbQ/XkdQ domain-containing protein n=1 Tax=Paenibacillus eucommiae TaxID=1355755 RepID=A0ABS4ITK3_9BACL|nr:hypothetical protein [Paenibacillus eucommiae]MBP1990206.1 hypothetical protein [Paenibacillus eucommiae]
MLKIEIDNRDGRLWDISGIVSSADYKTIRNGEPSTFSFTLIKGGLYEYQAFKYAPGDVIRVTKDGAKLFFGYIFSIDSGRDEDVSITAFDQLKYLLANDYFIGIDITATEVVRRIAESFNLKVGVLEDTKYKIPRMAEDNSKLLDIICTAINHTLIATTQMYMLFDDFGELSLQNIQNLTLDLSLGDRSLVYDYSQKRSIEESSNRIKLVKKNKEKGVREIYISQDNANIAKWGLLQFFQDVDEKMNEAQIDSTLTNLMKLKNRERRSFQLEAIGDVRVRAGRYVSINIAELSISQYFLVNSCSHKFDGAEHTMSLELMDIRIGDVSV